MTLHPSVPIDLVLAPVAIEIDRNLEGLRDRPATEILAELELRLDRPPIPNSRDDRQREVLEAAVRNVDLHRWQAAITQDACRLHLSGGSVTLDLGLGAALAHYIEAGA